MRRFLFLSAVAAVMLAACSDSDSPEKRTDPNANRNNTDLMAHFGQLEFPKLKGGMDNPVFSYATGELDITYSLEWDTDKQAQRWVCFSFTREKLARTYEGDLISDRHQWTYEEDLPQDSQLPASGELEESYFPGTSDSYVAAQLCAPEDRLYNRDALKSTYMMINVVPQAGKFHDGVWERMAVNVRKWAECVDTLFVCRGGTIDKPEQILSRTKSGFIVPRYFFVALLGKTGNDYKALGFWVEHIDENRSSDLLGNYLVNIDKLEQLTGIDFFCNLPDATEETVESATTESIKQRWGL